MVRTADLPDLGAVTDDSTFVSDHSGTGAFSGSSVSAYIATKQRSLYFGYGPPAVIGAGGGVVDDSAAITSAFAASDDVAFPPGTYRISTNLTIARGKRLYIASDAQFSVDAGKTLTINGLIGDAPLQRIFSGAGAVVGLRQVYPEWWGAKGDGTGDDQPAMAAAHTCVQGSRTSDGGRPTIRLMGANYQVARTWTVAPTADINLAVIGNGVIFSGTRIIAASSFSPAGPVMGVDGSTNGAQRITDFVLRDFGIFPSTSGYGLANVGLRIGNPAADMYLQGLHWNLVENVSIGALPCGISVVHTSLLMFRRCSVWNGGLTVDATGMQIIVNGGYTGDIRFHNCQWVNDVSRTNNRAIAFVCSSGAFTIGPGPAGVINCIAGIMFDGCDIYPGYTKVYMYSSNGGSIQDVWFDRCQWDGSSYCDMWIESVGNTSLIEDLHFDNCYLAGGNLSGTQDQIQIASTGTGGRINAVFFNDTILKNAARFSLAVNGNGGHNIQGLSLNGVTCRDNNNTTGAAMQFNDCAKFNVLGCQAAKLTTAFSKYLIGIDSQCTSFVVANNNSGQLVVTACVNDLTGAIVKTVTGNI